MKEVGNNTNVDFEADRCDEIEVVVATMVHNRMNMPIAMDVEKRLMAVSWAIPQAAMTNSDVEECTAPQEASEGFDHEHHVHYVGKGNSAGRQAASISSCVAVDGRESCAGDLAL